MLCACVSCIKLENTWEVQHAISIQACVWEARWCCALLLQGYLARRVFPALRRRWRAQNDDATLIQAYVR